MVLACESIFSRTSLDGRPRNLHTFSKVNLKYTKRTFPVGQARCSFHLPHSYNLQIILARGNGASTNVEPWRLFYVFMRHSPSRPKWFYKTNTRFIQQCHPNSEFAKTFQLFQYHKSMCMYVCIYLCMYVLYVCMYVTVK